MSDLKWLTNFNAADRNTIVDGLVPVKGYDKTGQPAAKVAIMEKAEHYEADAVFFEATPDGNDSVAQAFIYCSDTPKDSDFAKLHRRLWSWGNVPLVYRVTPGFVQLFRCAHGPDFESKDGIDCQPFQELKRASEIANDPWWKAERLRTGTLWDDPDICKQLLSSEKAVQKTLINEVRKLHQELNGKKLLSKALSRRLLILSVLIAYLEQRGVFEDGFFGRFVPGASKFFQVLADGPALIDLLDHLEARFNGNVFVIDDEDRKTLRESCQLTLYAQLVEARQVSSGQRTLWQRYSFADLPVELISHIYQLFVEDRSTAVYTPHFVVRLLLGEVLDWDRLDRLNENDEVILDPACGSGIFLVEAYKRLVLHWRARHNWIRPDQETLKHLLTTRLRGIDLENGAVELAAFSLCLALCDELEPMDIRTSVKLFPPLKENTIHTGCFFEICERDMIKKQVGVIVGNPPFASKLSTAGAKRAYRQYQQEHGTLPDKQVAYLFLHQSMEMLTPGGVLSMLQQYNFLYNQLSAKFRSKFIERWDVREILDFISIRGLFKKGGSDTKVIGIVAESKTPPQRRQILHAIFRRSGRVDAQQGFDIDYYDMHWLPRELALNNDTVWRCDLLGGGRTLSFMDRLKKYRTLKQLSDESGWESGGGWTIGNANRCRPAEHIIGKPFVEPKDLSNSELLSSTFGQVPDKHFERPRHAKIYTPPLLLIHKHEDLSFGTYNGEYLTYPNTIIGFSAKSGNQENLRKAALWLGSQIKTLQAVIALSSTTAFTAKATAVLVEDIVQLPFPKNWDLNLTSHEQILIADIVDYYRDLIRLGQESAAMKETGIVALPAFNDVFTTRINGIYKKNTLRPLQPHTWTGVICQPYIFGEGKVDWTGANELKGKLDALLKEKRGGGLNVTRIARLYDGACIYMLKPNRLRYWLRSIALRDADETLADLAEQGF